MLQTALASREVVAGQEAPHVNCLALVPLLYQWKPNKTLIICYYCSEIDLATMSVRGDKEKRAGESTWVGKVYKSTISEFNLISCSSPFPSAVSIDLSPGKAIAHREPVFAFSQSDWDVWPAFCHCGHFCCWSLCPSGVCLCALFESTANSQQTATGPLLEHASKANRQALLFTLSLRQGAAITRHTCHP